MTLGEPGNPEDLLGSVAGTGDHTGSPAAAARDRGLGKTGSVSEIEKQAWWRGAWWKELFHKEVLFGHVINSVVALAVGFVVGLLATLFWVIWSALHHSPIWTQRAIGASMAFAVSIIMTSVTLAFLRRRLAAPSAGRPATGKGYLDHKADSLKSSTAITRRLTNITALTIKETKRTKARTVRLQRLYKLPDSKKRLSLELAEARREARTTDLTTRKIAKETVLLAKAIETYTTAELEYWKWNTQHHRIDATNAQMLVQLMENQLRSIDENLRVRAEARTTTVARLGRSQVLNEAVERRLVLIDRQAAAMASQKTPLQEVVALLRPLTMSPQANCRS
jgi:hypothetical protein